MAKEKRGSKRNIDVSKIVNKSEELGADIVPVRDAAMSVLGVANMVTEGSNLDIPPMTSTKGDYVTFGLFLRSNLQVLNEASQAVFAWTNTGDLKKESQYRKLLISVLTGQGDSKVGMVTKLKSSVPEVTVPLLGTKLGTTERKIMDAGVLQGDNLLQKDLSGLLVRVDQAADDIAEIIAIAEKAGENIINRHQGILSGAKSSTSRAMEAHRNAEHAGNEVTRLQAELTHKLASGEVSLTSVQTGTGSAEELTKQAITEFRNRRTFGVNLKESKKRLSAIVPSAQIIKAAGLGIEGLYRIAANLDVAFNLLLATEVIRIQKALEMCNVAIEQKAAHDAEAIANHLQELVNSTNRIRAELKSQND